MAGRTRKDMKAAQDAAEILLNTLPKSETGIHNIAYTFGLICREAGIPAEQAADFIMSWSERLRAIPNFKELIRFTENLLSIATRCGTQCEAHMRGYRTSPRRTGSRI